MTHVPPSLEKTRWSLFHFWEKESSCQYAWDQSGLWHCLAGLTHWSAESKSSPPFLSLLVLTQFLKSPHRAVLGDAFLVLLCAKAPPLYFVSASNHVCPNCFPGSHLWFNHRAETWLFALVHIEKYIQTRIFKANLLICWQAVLWKRCPLLLEYNWLEFSHFTKWGKKKNPNLISNVTFIMMHMWWWSVLRKIRAEHKIKIHLKWIIKGAILRIKVG